MKLYWRVKIDGKWTYKAAETYLLKIGDNVNDIHLCVNPEGEQ